MTAKMPAKGNTRQLLLPLPLSSPAMQLFLVFSLDMFIFSLLNTYLLSSTQEEKAT
jgi:hypothetical protein